MCAIFPIPIVFNCKFHFYFLSIFNFPWTLSLSDVVPCCWYWCCSSLYYYCCCCRSVVVVPNIFRIVLFHRLLLLLLRLPHLHLILLIIKKKTTFTVYSIYMFHSLILPTLVLVLYCSFCVCCLCYFWVYSIWWCIRDDLCACDWHVSTCVCGVWCRCGKSLIDQRLCVRNDLNNIIHTSFGDTYFAWTTLSKYSWRLWWWWRHRTYFTPKTT